MPSATTSLLQINDHFTTFIKFKKLLKLKTFHYSFNARIKPKLHMWCKSFLFYY